MGGLMWRGFAVGAAYYLSLSLALSLSVSPHLAYLARDVATRLVRHAVRM